MSEIHFSSRRLIIISSVSVIGIVLSFLLIQFIKITWWVNPATVILHVMPLLGLWAGLLLPDIFILQFSALVAWIKKHTTLCAILCSSLCFTVLVYVNRSILFSFMNSADEHSCYFMAQYLSAGYLWATPHPMKEFFETPHIGAIANKWFSVYPPGWPLLWALGLKLNMKDTLNPLVTALSVFWMFRLGKLVYGNSAVFLAFFFLLVSPFFLLTGAAYYSHNLCLLLILLFMEAAWRWQATGYTRWAFGAGLILAGAAATRYLTAAALGFPVIVYMTWMAIKRKGAGMKAYVLFLATFVGLNVLHFYYNYLITGNLLNPPNHFLRSHEKLGFILGYTPAVAIDYFWKRILYLVDWTPPGVVILFLFFVLSSKIRNFWDAIFRFNCILIAFAYMFYYSWGGGQYGPRYLFEGYPFLLISVSVWLCELWRQGDIRIKKCLLGFAIAMWLSALPLLLRHFDFFRSVSHERRMTFVAAETDLQYPALVFIKGFLGSTLIMSQEDAIRNSPFLTTKVIYALDLGEENRKLMNFFPNRHKYQVAYDPLLKLPVFKKIND